MQKLFENWQRYQKEILEETKTVLKEGDITDERLVVAFLKAKAALLKKMKERVGKATTVRTPRVEPTVSSRDVTTQSIPRLTAAERSQRRAADAVKLKSKLFGQPGGPGKWKPLPSDVSPGQEPLYKTKEPVVVSPGGRKGAKTIYNLPPVTPEQAAEDLANKIKDDLKQLNRTPKKPGKLTKALKKIPGPLGWLFKAALFGSTLAAADAAYAKDGIPGLLRVTAEEAPITGEIMLAADVLYGAMDVPPEEFARPDDSGGYEPPGGIGQDWLYENKKSTSRITILIK